MQRESFRKFSVENPVLPSTGQNDSSKPEINPIKTILIRKGAEVFGISVNIVDSVGVVVTSVTPGSSGAQDGRLQTGDVLVSLNNQSLVDVEPRRVGEILRSVDKSTSDVLVQYIVADKAPEQTARNPPIDSLRQLQRSQTKSDEEEDEYFDVPESEPPNLPSSPPPTLMSEILPQTRMQPDIITSITTTTTKPIPPKTKEASSISKIVLPKISPIILPARPSVPSPKPMIRVTTPTEGAGKSLDSIVSKVKPTVPFKPVRTSLSPKDALPSRAKSKPTTIENLVGESTPSGISRQWGPQRTVELWRDPEKGLGISIISGKVDTLHGGIFIKNVLSDSPAGWNGTLKRGDRILEVNGEDIRNAGHAKAVDVIKNATNPVKFVIQSLVPLPKKSDVEAPPVAQELPPPVEESEFKTPKPRTISPVSRLSSVQSPVSVSLIPGTPSASSSNSSSRESTIKRSSSKDPAVPTSPSAEQCAKGTEAPRPLDDTDARKKVQPVDEEQKEDQLPELPLAKGKVLSKKGKQIDITSAGNLKLTPVERAEDPESEDEFGYTHSNLYTMKMKEYHPRGLAQFLTTLRCPEGKPFPFANFWDYYRSNNFHDLAVTKPREEMELLMQL